MFQPDKLRELVGVPTRPKKADHFTLESLIAWLRTKAAGESYNWHDCNGMCLIGQYIHHVGLLDGGYSRFVDEWRARNPYDIQRIASALGEESFPHTTFGAALKRALAYQGGSNLRSVERP